MWGRGPAASLPNPSDGGAGQSPPAATPPPHPDPSRLIDPWLQMLPTVTKDTPELCAEACLADAKCIFWSWCPADVTGGCVWPAAATCPPSLPAATTIAARFLSLPGLHCYPETSRDGCTLTLTTPRPHLLPGGLPPTHLSAHRRCPVAGANGTTATTLAAKTCLLSFDTSTTSLAVFAMYGNEETVAFMAGPCWA